MRWDIPIPPGVPCLNSDIVFAIRCESVTHRLAVAARISAAFKAVFCHQDDVKPAILAFAFLHTAAWLLRLWLTRDEWRAHKAAAQAAPPPRPPAARRPPARPGSAR